MKRAVSRVLLRVARRMSIAILVPLPGAGLCGARETAGGGGLSEPALGDSLASLRLRLGNCVSGNTSTG